MIIHVHVVKFTVSAAIFWIYGMSPPSTLPGIIANVTLSVQNMLVGCIQKHMSVLF